MNGHLVGLTVAALTVAIVGLTVALIVVAGDEGSGATSSSLVPIVIGKDEAKAETVLRGGGFEVASRSIPKNLLGLEAPKGTVLQQNPPAGSPAEAGSTVTLTVSAGSS